MLTFCDKNSWENIRRRNEIIVEEPNAATELNEEGKREERKPLFGDSQDSAMGV